MSGRGSHEAGIRWVRPPEFSDDLDVADLYEWLLADGEVAVTHEFRTKAAKPGENVDATSRRSGLGEAQARPLRHS